MGRDRRRRRGRHGAGQPGSRPTSRRGASPGPSRSSSSASTTSRPPGAESALTALVKACVDNDQLVVAEGESGFFTTNYGLQSLLKTSRSGLALHPDGNEGLSVFKANLPALNRAELPPGRGFVIEKGKFELIQIALP